MRRLHLFHRRHELLHGLLELLWADYSETLQGAHLVHHATPPLRIGNFFLDARHDELHELPRVHLAGAGPTSDEVLVPV